MGQYTDLSTLKQRIEYNKEDFGSTSSGMTVSGFESLLTQCEEESRSIIESYKGDIQFDNETKSQTFHTIDDSSIPLEYPVQNITASGVEYKVRPGDDWNELQDDRFSYSEHRLILDKYPRNYNKFNVKSRFDRTQTNINRLNWSDFCHQIRVTYERGYDTVPANVKNVQIALIRKMLGIMRNGQNVEALNPEEVQNYFDVDVLLTEDVVKRLDSITSLRNKVRSI